MTEIIPIIVGLGPYAIVVFLLAFLWRSLAKGDLATRDQLERQIQSKDEVVRLYNEALEVEREARIAQASAIMQLLEAGRIVADGLDALRKVAEENQ